MSPTAPASVDWSAFELLSTETPKCFSWASTGEDGSGKSHFGLTAPDPIYVAAFDPYGMNRVSADVKVGKDIRIGRYPFNLKEAGDDKAAVSRKATEVWERFVRDFRTALKHVRTILIDREDNAWELIRYSNFGGMSSAPKDYADLYIEYVGLIQEAAAAGVNLGMLRGLKEKWANKFDASKGKMVPYSTGEMIPDGMSKLKDHVDITLVHRWDDTERQFFTKIQKFPNPDFRSQEFPGMAFLQVASLAFPDTTEEDWGGK